MSLKERAKKLKAEIPAFFIALKKKETPILAKVTAAITICYFLSPIDLIPDFIPVLGYLDDIIILPVLVALTIKLIPKELLQKCIVESEAIWKDGKPKKWYYSIPIIIIWILILIAIIKVILGV